MLTQFLNKVRTARAVAAADHVHAGPPTLSHCRCEDLLYPPPPIAPASHTAKPLRALSHSPSVCLSPDTIPQQLECDRLGASDCDSPEVNSGGALLMKYVLALQFSCATLSLGTIGALCDYAGRRPAMIVTTVGQVWNVVMVLIALRSPFKLAMALILVGTAVNGLLGSYGTYLTVGRKKTLARCTPLHSAAHPPNVPN